MFTTCTGRYVTIQTRRRAGGVVAPGTRTWFARIATFISCRSCSPIRKDEVAMRSWVEWIPALTWYPSCPHVCVAQVVFAGCLTLVALIRICKRGRLFFFVTITVTSMGSKASYLTCLLTVCLTVCSGWHQRSASLALCKGNPLVTGGFHSQRAGDAESVFM